MSRKIFLAAFVRRSLVVKRTPILSGRHLVNGKYRNSDTKWSWRFCRWRGGGGGGEGGVEGGGVVVKNGAAVL